jgi:hypothetical protein
MMRSTDPFFKRRGKALRTKEVNDKGDKIKDGVPNVIYIAVFLSAQQRRDQIVILILEDCTFSSKKKYQNELLEIEWLQLNPFSRTALSITNAHARWELAG